MRIKKNIGKLRKFTLRKELVMKAKSREAVEEVLGEGWKIIKEEEIEE